MNLTIYTIWEQSFLLAMFARRGKSLFRQGSPTGYERSSAFFELCCLCLPYTNKLYLSIETTDGNRLLHAIYNIRIKRCRDRSRRIYLIVVLQQHGPMQALLAILEVDVLRLRDTVVLQDGPHLLLHTVWRKPADPYLEANMESMCI